MTVYENVSDLVGNTPLIELTHYQRDHGLKARLIGKVESFNPAGSIKDRVAKAMIDDAVERGVLGEHTVIIEPTSGFAPSLPPAATASSSPCPRPCRQNGATS